jgi:CMP/dCMP kinase
MIITISGQAGSGKSSVAKYLADKLKLKHYSMGDLRRKMARDRNMSLAALNELGEKEDFTDKQVDKAQEDLGKQENNFVMDGRLSYYFIPKSIKIYIKAKLRTRAERVYSDERAEEKFRDIGDSIASLIERERSDKKRYEKYYELDCNNELQYDLIIDSTQQGVDEVGDEVIEFLKRENIIKYAD